MEEEDYMVFAEKLEDANYHTQSLMITAMNKERFDILRELSVIAENQLLQGSLDYEDMVKRNKLAKQLGA